MSNIMKQAELCRDKTVYIHTHNFSGPGAIASAFCLRSIPVFLLYHAVWSESIS